MTGRRLSAALLALAVASGCSKDEKSAPATLARVELTPPAPSLAAGTTVQLRATAVYSDGSRRDVTFTAGWSSSIPAVAAIADGLLRGGAPGTATVRALYEGAEGSAAVEVTAAALVSLSIHPPILALHAGRGAALAATGLFSDGTTQDVTEQATWTSDAAAVAFASDAAGSRGHVDAAGVGMTAVHAALSGRVATVQVAVTAAEVVTISIDPPARTVAVGATAAFTATALYSDGTTADVTADVLWTASGAVAVFPTGAPAGTVRPIAVGGPVSVLAVLPGAPAPGAATLTVTPASLVSIDVTPASLVLAKGAVRRLVATGVYSDASRADLTAVVDWATSAATVAGVSSAGGEQGTVTAVAPGGPVRITATGPGGLAGFSDVTVSPAALASLAISPVSTRVAAGATAAFTATATWTDGTTRDVTADVTWTSVDPSIAPISSAAGSAGVATGLRAGGPVALSAQLPGSAVVAGAALTVDPPTLVRVDVVPPDLRLAKGTTAQLRAVARFSDGSVTDVTGQAAWTSSDAGVAPVSAATLTAGTVSGLAAGGPVTIGATFLGVAATAAQVTVTPAVLASLAVSPATGRLPLGRAQPFTAVGTFSDGTTQDLTVQVAWLSDDPATVSVSNAAGSQGKAQSHAEGGPVAITAIFPGTALAATASLTVDPPALLAIAVAPATASIPKGRTQRFTATGSYTDGVFRDVTVAATWTSSASGVAALSSAPGEEGLARGVAQGGPVAIRATVGVVVGEAVLVVRRAEVVSLALSPDAPWLERGQAMQLVALATFTDELVADVASTATWASSSPAAVSVAAGRIEGRARGASVITATADGVSATATVNVVARRPVSLAILPAGVAVAPGTVVAFTAVGTFADGTQADVTQDATWTSSDGDVAAGAPQQPGAYMAAGEGTATIGATLGASSSVEMTVSAHPPALTLSALFLGAEQGRLGAGGLLQLHAVGWFTDGSSRDVTETASWTTSDGATVALLAGAPGVVSGVAPGIADVAASFGGRSATLRLTVLDPSAPVTKLELLAPAWIASGQQGVPVRALATRIDGRVDDVTADAAWSSADPGVLRAMESGWFEPVGPGTATIEASIGGASGSAVVRVLTAEETLQAGGFRIVPGTAIVGSGNAFGFGLVATDASGISRVVHYPLWESTDPEVVEFLQYWPGMGAAFHAGRLGTATVRPTAFLAGVEAQVQVVQDPGMPVLSAVVLVGEPFATVGQRIHLQPVVVMSDGTPGSAALTWSSSDPDVLAPDLASPGYFEAAGVGRAVVTATAPGGVAATAQIDVLPPDHTLGVAIRGPARVALGGAVQLWVDGLAFGDSVAWTSGNPSRAAFDPAAPGVLRGLAEGTVRVFATTPGGIAGFLDVAVVAIEQMRIVPSHGEVAIGWDLRYQLLVEYSDGYREWPVATWTSANPWIAAPEDENPGWFRAISPGPTTIQAEYAASTATASLLVTFTDPTPRPDTLLVRGPIDLLAGESAYVAAWVVQTDGSEVAVDASFAWTSLAPGVATFDDLAVPRVRAVAAGTTTVAVSGPGGLADTAQVVVRSLTGLEVTPANVSIPLGTMAGFQVWATDDRGEVRDANWQVAWSTANAGIALFPDLQQYGAAVRGVARGTTTVTATWPGGVMASAEVTVTDPVAVSLVVEPASPWVELADTVAFRAVATLTDGSVADVTNTAAWSLAPGSAALEAVGAPGTFRAVGLGEAHPVAAVAGQFDVVTATAYVYVPSPVTAIGFEPPPNVPLGLETGVSLWIQRVDGSLAVVTGVGACTADGVFVQVVEPGRIRGLQEGTGSLTVTYAGLTVTTDVQVLPPVITALEISGPTAPLEPDEVATFTATGTYSDGIVADVTDRVVWYSVNACISEPAPDVGPGAFRVGPCGWGQGLIGAGVESAYSSATAFASLEFLPRVTYVEVTAAPWGDIVAVGVESLPYRAVAWRADESWSDVTAQAIWSSDPTYAVPVEGKPGVFRGVSPGSTEVKATFVGTWGTAPLDVRAPRVLEFEISCPSAPLEMAELAVCTATGFREDGFTGDVTADVTWRALTTWNVAPVEGTPGTFSAVDHGTATISASAWTGSVTVEHTAQFVYLAPP